MHRTSQKKLGPFVLAPGLLIVVLTVVVYSQIESAQAERRTASPAQFRTPNPRPERLRPTTESLPLNVVAPQEVSQAEGPQTNDAVESNESALTGRQLTLKEANGLLQANLLLPWTIQAMPEHRIMSRAAPRVEVRPTFDMEAQPFAGVFLGVVSLQRYREHQELPVVIDRRQGEIFVFAHNRWQSSKHWLRRNKKSADVKPLR